MSPSAGELERWRAWRPMSFGSRPARTIRDPVIEPLWPGRRVLVHLSRNTGERDTDEPSLLIVDEDGAQLAGHPELRAAVLEAALASALVVDAYLVALPRLGATGMFGGEPAVAAPGLGQTARQLVIGDRGVRGQGASLTAGTDLVGFEPPALDAAHPLPQAIAALVAVDLLAIDSEAVVDVPLLERKRLLDSVLAAGPHVRLGPHVRPPVEPWYGQWRAFGFREIAVKSANSHYHPGHRSDDWAVARLPRG